MNLLQDIVNVAMGSDAFQVSELPVTIQFMGCIFLVVFAYMALRSMARFFLNLGTRF